MTVDNLTSAVTFPGNGAATTFTTAFELNSSTEVSVHLVLLSTGAETVLTTSDYSIPALSTPAVGVITYPLVGTPMPSTYALRVVRATNTLQPVNVTNQTGYNADVVMQVWDKLARVAQEQATALAGALRLPEGSTLTPLIVPATGIVGKTIVFNAAGDGLEVGPTTTEMEGHAATASSNATAAAASETAAGLSETAAGLSETAAGTSETNAAASASSAASNASLISGSETATAADRVATAADRAATAQHVVDTAAATNSDAVATAADRVVTTQDALDTAADVVLTNADAAATAADLLLTDADTVATAADRTAVAADLVQTNIDQLATAADRVQTGLDAAATAADLVQTNIDQLAVAADATQVATDRTAVAADLALTDADTTATAADRAAVASDLLLTAADTVATAADRAAVAADLLLTDADTTATAADRVQTGLDAVATAADAAATAQDAIDTAADLVQTNQDTIDTAADLVQTAQDVIDTAASRDAASTSAANALASKNSAETAETNAAATAAGLSGLDLNAIAQSKAITAVDGFVYDTRNDSDGGAWIYGAKARASSWYNETLNTSTRGATRAFPAVAVIIAESGKVTIYDGDDPDLPMWMVFSAGNANVLRGVSGFTSITALNGIVCRGATPTGSYDLVGINFPADWAARVGTTNYVGPYGGSISERNDGGNYLTSAAGYLANEGIISRTVNDVTMTVLPNAPIDPATGLQVPTIYVGTATGVSRIADDGTVSSTTTAASVPITTIDVYDGYVTASAQHSGGAETCILPVTTALSGSSSWLSSSWDAIGGITYDDGNGGAPHVWNTRPQVTGYASNAVATTSGLALLKPNYPDSESGLVGNLTSTYNTGWMQGDIKGAWLSSVDATDLVGTELVTNGDFASGTSGYVTSGDVSVVAGEAVVSDVGGTDAYLSQQIVGVSTGETIKITFDQSAGSNLFLQIGSEAGSNSDEQFSNLGVGSTTVYLAAKRNDPFITFRSFFTDSSNTVDNFSVRLADPDRSVNGNGLAVYGTVTKTAVATGAELMAYGPFSSTNNFLQPVNPDLAFGTGPFCCVAWVDTTDIVGNDYICSRGNEFLFAYGSSVGVGLGTNGSLQATGGVLTSGWTLCVAVRENGLITIYTNGVQTGTPSANTFDISSTTLEFGVGGYWTGSAWSQMMGGKIALLRISGTAPSAAQIAKIYEDEKHLFTDNALAVLSADAVTALSHDPAADLLYVGGASGTATVAGITPVSRDATAVSTFISVVDGMEIKQ